MVNFSGAQKCCQNTYGGTFASGFMFLQLKPEKESYGVIFTLKGLLVPSVEFQTQIRSPTHMTIARLIK